MPDITGLIVIAVVFIIPTLILAGAFWFWTYKKSMTAILYYDGIGIRKLDKKIKDNNMIIINDTTHIIAKAEAMTYKPNFYSPKQLCFAIHKDVIPVIDVKKIFDGMPIDAINPETLKIVMEGKDIKNAHATLNAMDKFSLSNPMLWAGLGIGAAIGIGLMILFYKPSIPVQVIAAPQETVKQAVQIVGFLIFR